MSDPVVDRAVAAAISQGAHNLIAERAQRMANAAEAVVACLLQHLDNPADTVAHAAGVLGTALGLLNRSTKDADLIEVARRAAENVAALDKQAAEG